MSISNRRILMNAFFKLQLLSSGMDVYSRINHTKINTPHGRCLRIIHNEHTSSFENLLEKDGSVSIHSKNLQIQATEMFQINRGISSSIMKDIFEPRAEHPYNLRCISQFSAPLVVRKVFHGTESIYFLGPKI